MIEKLIAPCGMNCSLCISYQAMKNDLKKQGFWVVGADPEKGTSYHDVDLTGPVVIVIGDEGEGMARLTRERCDSLVQIPMRGKVQSLNASVASAIILYEMIRQRDAAGLLKQRGTP